MLQRCIAALALAEVAAAMQPESLLALQGTSRRSLQRSGAADVNVCRANNQVTRQHGTIHDDATDEVVDCTAEGNTCGQAGGNTGYGCEARTLPANARCSTLASSRAAVHAALR